MSIFRELKPDPELMNLAVRDFRGERPEPVRRYTFRSRAEVLRRQKGLEPGSSQRVKGKSKGLIV